MLATEKESWRRLRPAPAQARMAARWLQARSDAPKLIVKSPRSIDLRLRVARAGWQRAMRPTAAARAHSLRRLPQSASVTFARLRVAPRTPGDGHVRSVGIDVVLRALLLWIRTMVSALGAAAATGLVRAVQAAQAALLAVGRAAWAANAVAVCWERAIARASNRAAQSFSARAARARPGFVRGASAIGDAAAAGLDRSVHATRVALLAVGRAASAANAAAVRWERETAASSIRTAQALSARAAAAGTTLSRTAAAMGDAAAAGAAHCGRAVQSALRTVARAAWACVSRPPLLVARAMVRWERATAAAMARAGRAIALAPAHALEALRRKAPSVGSCPACGRRVHLQAQLCSFCGKEIAAERATTSAAAVAKSIGSGILAASWKIFLIALYFVSLLALVVVAVVLGAAVTAR